MGVLELVGNSVVMRAIAASLIASVLSAVVGSFTVSRGLSTMGAAIAHSSLAGAILGFLLGVEPLIGAVILSLIFALFISKGGRTHTRRDMILGVAFGLSAAIAAMSLSLVRAYTTTAMNYLVGDVMGVSSAEILLLFAFGLASLIIVAVFYKEFKFMIFDMEAAEAMGLDVNLYNHVLIVLIAVTTVVELKVVGSIVAVVFLVAPAASAFEFSHSFEEMMFFSILFAVGSAIAGAAASLTLNLPCGPTMGVFASIIYLLSMIFSTRRRGSCGPVICRG